MKHRLRYLGIGFSNGLSQIPWWALVILPPLLAGWIAALVLLPAPEDRLVHYLSLVAVAAGFAVPVWFHVALDLRSRYPLPVLIAGGLCLLLSGFCLWREFSPALLLRLGLPLLLTGLLGYYIFYFSVYRGKECVSRLQVGDRFPDFSLPDSEGRTVSLASLLAKGPALMLFYKGDW